MAFGVELRLEARGTNPVPPLSRCCTTSAASATAPWGRGGLEAGAAADRGRWSGAAGAGLPLAAAARLRSVRVECGLAGPVPLPGFGGFLPAGCRPEAAESDARSQGDTVAPPGAPDVGNAPGGARALPADDEPMRASRRTYPPWVTAPGGGGQAANKALAGAWAAIVGERVGRGSRGKRCRVRSSQLRRARRTEGSEPSGTLGAVASKDGSSPGKRDVRIATGAATRQGAHHPWNIGHEGSRLLIGRSKRAILEVNLLHGGLVESIESISEGRPPPKAGGKRVLEGEKDARLADDV